MHEINCPHCGKAFKIDESGYADIVKQVRGTEFDQTLHVLLALAEKVKQSAVDLAMANQLEQAKHEHEAAVHLTKAKSLNELQKAPDTITQAVRAVEKERDHFKGGLERAELEVELAQKALKDKYETQINHPGTGACRVLGFINQGVGLRV